MRGRVTLFWIALAVMVGFGLFQVKYEVQSLEDELRHLNAEITAEQELLHVLRAEWAYLNRPARLEDLSARYLSLQQPTADQIRALETLPPRPEPVRADGPIDGGDR